MRARKAFIFTADAVLAFYLVTILISLLLLINYTPRIYTEQFQTLGSDVLFSLSTLRLSDVSGNPLYNYSSNLDFIQNNSLTIWPMFLRTPTHNNSVSSVYPTSNSTWLLYRIGPTSASVTEVRSSPILYNGMVIISSQNGTYAYDENTGNQLWYLPIPAYSSPMVYEGYTLLASSNQGTLNNTVFAIDGMGQMIWNTSVNSGINSSLAIDNGKIFLGLMNNSLVALDLDSGRLLNWSFTASSNISATPAVYNGTIYVYSHDGNLYAVDENSGNVLWNYSSGLSNFNLYIDPSPALANGLVYFTNGSYFYEVNMTTGLLAATYNTTSGYEFTSSPVVDNQTVYIGCNATGSFGLCKLTPNFLLQTITLTQVYSTSAAIYSTPIVTNSSIILATSGGDIATVDKSSMSALWDYKAGGPVYSSPALVNGRIYIGADDGNLYSFGNCSIWNGNFSVIDSIAAFWAINRKGCAQSIAGEFLSTSVPTGYGFELVIKPPSGTGQQCSSCYYCNGSASTKWDSIYTNDCNQTKYQRFLITDSRYISGILETNSNINYIQKPIEAELRIWS